jgi:hypothetical protein
MVAILPTLNVWAIDNGMSPGMVALGPFDFIPLLKISESHSDNIFFSNLSRKSSLITQIQGGGELALRRKLDRYALHYSFLSSQYHSSPADNYVDNNLEATAHFDITQRNRLNFSSGLIYSHLMRGTRIFEGTNINSEIYYTQPVVIQPGVGIAFLSEPDEYHQYSADIDYRYGRIDAQGNLGLQLGWNETIYDNHPLRTLLWNRTQFQITPGFYWRLKPKVYLSAHVQNTFVNFHNSEEGYSLRRYLVGIDWAQSSKTKGSIHIGYFQQETNSSVQNSTNGLTWNGHLQWSPLTYSTLSFNFSKEILPAIGSSLFAQLQVYDAIWQHSWQNNFTTELSCAYQEILYPNAAGTQNGIIFKFDIKYQMRSWLNIGANYLQSDFQGSSVQSSSDSAAKSTQNTFMLYINVMPQVKTY